MVITTDDKTRREIQENLMPVHVYQCHAVECAEELMKSKPACVSFQTEGWTKFKALGSFVVLDFGKELCGGIRIITCKSNGNTKWRISFGESLSEACSTIGVKNATNDHSPRDIEVMVSSMSDLTFGQTGFRFVRLELLSEEPVSIQNIFAVSHLPEFHTEAEITTNDSVLNEIIKTAKYTLKLNFQNGYIWDGIKRDRLVWCGDLHPEILASIYLFGDVDNIENSLSFLRDSTSAEKWINSIPSYSAWWIINLCDYCCMTGNKTYYMNNRDYIAQIIKHFNQCINDDGTACLKDDHKMEYFLDWSTYGTLEAKIGVCALLHIMIEKFQKAESVFVSEVDRMWKCEMACKRILEKLDVMLDANSKLKPVRAFQILAGRTRDESARDLFEDGGAKGFSTFMAYYILTAMGEVGSVKMLDVLKEYYGGMLEKGATTFWEDFDVEWLENSCRIDEMPQKGQRDIHGDFGKYCYKQFRHSLCHGWSAGVVAFVVEYILGVHIKDGGKTVYVQPQLLGLTDVDAYIPIGNGVVSISIHGKQTKVVAPDGIKIIV